MASYSSSILLYMLCVCVYLCMFFVYVYVFNEEFFSTYTRAEKSRLFSTDRIRAKTSKCKTPRRFPYRSSRPLRPNSSLLHLLSAVFDNRSSPHPQLILRSVTSGTSRDFGKNDDEKNRFYFFTYEWSRRRLSLIKMIHGAEEVLMLLFTAFRYEYLFLSYVVRVWIVRLFIREKIWFVSKRHTTKKKEEDKPKISGEKNVATKVFRVLIHFVK